MKTSLLLAMILISATFSVSAHAKPPSPPATIAQEIRVIICTYLNSNKLEDLSEIDNSSIVSFDEMTYELCTTVKK